MASTGQIVRSASLADGGVHAGLWFQGRVADLGVVAGDPQSAAFAINSAGLVVRSSATSGGQSSRACLYFDYFDGRMVDLTERIPAGSGWVLETAAIPHRSRAFRGS